VFARQALYHLSHTSSPLGHFFNKSLLGTNYVVGFGNAAVTSQTQSLQFGENNRAYSELTCPICDNSSTSDFVCI
jgi:hypothetical protein